MVIANIRRGDLSVCMIVYLAYSVLSWADCDFLCDCDLSMETLRSQWLLQVDFVWRSLAFCPAYSPVRNKITCMRTQRK